MSDGAKAFALNYSLPAAVTLKGDRVAVALVPPSTLAEKPEDHCDGAVNFHDSLIRIREDSESQGAFRILGHEIAHFYLAWGGADAALHAVLESDAAHHMVEAICDCMGAMLVEVIRDNPELVAAVRRNNGQ